MVTEHKIRDSRHLVACLAMSYQLRAWLWLVVSGKHLSTGNGVLGNIRGRKKLWGLRAILPCISEDVGFRGKVCMC